MTAKPMNKTTEALVNITQIVLRYRGAERVTPSPVAIECAVQECAPLLGGYVNVGDRLSAVLELATRYGLRDDDDARRNPVKTETRIPASDFLAAEISNRR